MRQKLREIAYFLLVVFVIVIVLTWIFRMDSYTTQRFAPNVWAYKAVQWWTYIGIPWAIALWILLCAYVVGTEIFVRFKSDITVIDYLGNSLAMAGMGSRFKREWDSALTNSFELILRIAVGLGLIYFMAYLLGLAGWFHVEPLAIIGIIIVAIGIGNGTIRQLGEYFRDLRWWTADINTLSTTEVITYLVIGGYIIHTAYMACHPATGWDECNSHLVLARSYAITGHIAFMPWVSFANFPQFTEVLIGLQFLGTPFPSAILPTVFNVMTLILIFNMAREIFPKFYRSTLSLLCVLAYLSIPLVTQYSQAALTDPVLAFYCWLYLFVVVAKRVNLPTTAIIAGTLLCIKYTAIPWFLLVTVWLVWTNRKDRRGLVEFAQIVFIFIAPWIARNLFLFGNPLFPFYDSILRMSGGTTPPWMRLELVNDHADMLKFFRIESWREFLMLPWSETMRDDAPWCTAIQPSNIGPWLLALSPLVIWELFKVGAKGRIVAAIAGAYLAYWVGFERIFEWRYLLPFVLFAAVFSAAGLYRLVRPYAEKVLLIAALLSIPWWNTYCYPTSGEPRVMLEPQTRYEYLINCGKYTLPTVMCFNTAVYKGGLAPDTVVYGFWLENYRYYADFKLIGNIFGYASSIEFMRQDTPEKLWTWLRRYDTEYLIWSKRSMAQAVNYGELDLPNLQYDWNDYFEPATQFGGEGYDISVWKLKETPSE